MDDRKDIMDADGAPRAIADLSREELRALRALAQAGMIPPLDEAKGVLIEQDFTRRPARTTSISEGGRRPYPAAKAS